MTSFDLDAPEYCCAILRDRAGRYLIERRPAHSSHQPRRLTCFGGGREEGESPEACITRELREELTWDEGLIRSVGLRRAVRLESRARFIAWFFAGEPVDPACPIRCEHGYEAVWLSEGRLLAEPSLSSWHKAAISALIRGEQVAVVPK